MELGALEPIDICVVLVMASASFVRSTVGFGEALIAMPLIAFLAPVEMAAAYVALTALIVSLMILGTGWEEVQLAPLPGLILGSWLGIPIGFWVLAHAPRPVVLLGLAAVLAGFVTHRMRGPARWELRSDGVSWLFGVAAGVLGGAYNTAGPPVVIFGALRNWTPAQFRATIQAFALATLPAVVAGHWRGGRVTPRVITLFVLTIPVVACAVLAGRVVNRRISAHRFIHVVHVLLLLIAATLALSAVVDLLF